MKSIVRACMFFALTAGLFAADPVLKVVASGKTLAFTADEFAALPHVEATVVDPHDQKEHRYEGVAMRDIIAHADAPQGDKLRGAALQLIVIAHAKDGYAVVFALAEFDESFSDRTILLAEKEDGKALPDNAAPFRLIVPGDKKAARWARMITSFEIVPASSTVPAGTGVSVPAVQTPMAKP
jgi:hypothetical protein